MKKIILLIVLLLPFSIKALNLKENSIENIYYTIRGNNGNYVSYIYTEYSIDNKNVYCIEPYVHITTSNYISNEGLINSPYNDDINRLLQLYGYYGYDYPSHNTLRYKMATQALIWEKVTGQIVEFWTQRYGYGDYINIDYEKNEIIKLVNNHNKLPISNIDVDVFKEYTFDNFNNFIMEDNDIGHINDDRLYIKYDNIGSYNLSFKHRKYNEDTSTIFIGIDNKSQTLAYFNLDDNESLNLNVNIHGSRIKVNKKDENNNTIDNIFDFKISSDDYSYNFSTNNGYFITDILKEGIYTLEEIDNINHTYLFNSNKVNIEVKNNNEIDNIIEIDFINYTPKGVIEIYKKGEEVILDNGYKYKEIPLDNVVFNLYDKSYNLIDTLITDNNGYIKADNLELGTYILKEIKSSHDNIVDNKEYTINLEYIDQYTDTITSNLNIKNYLNKGNIIINKVDNHNIPIPDTLFEVYNDDIYLGEYKTDNNGKIVINDLPILNGKYYVKEVYVDNKYELSNDLIYFDLNSEINVVNKIKIDVPDTYNYSKSFIILIGLGFIIYGKKAM